MHVRLHPDYICWFFNRNWTTSYFVPLSEKQRVESLWPWLFEQPVIDRASMLPLSSRDPKRKLGTAPPRGF
jgi:hypothetical protein